MNKKFTECLQEEMTSLIFFFIKPNYIITKKTFKIKQSAIYHPLVRKLVEVKIGSGLQPCI